MPPCTQAAARSGADQVLEAPCPGLRHLPRPPVLRGQRPLRRPVAAGGPGPGLFRDAELVVLDEPTAALDPRAEAALFAAVREVFAGRSVVLISHRFATVRQADHIYVLDQGKVIEHGDHDQLMAHQGLYAELFTLQASAFGLEEPPSHASPSP